jgi:hypothetical protein
VTGRVTVTVILQQGKGTSRNQDNS